MDELNVFDAEPPQDEYNNASVPPPAYDNFEEAYVQWCAADKAKQDKVALDKDPVLAAAKTELKEAKEVLQRMEKERYDPYYSANDLISSDSRCKAQKPFGHHIPSEACSHLS